MQAKRQQRKKVRPAPARGNPAGRGRLVMNRPDQTPPVDRLYMRAVVGRQSPSVPPLPGRKAAREQKGKQTQPGGDYLIGLTTFPIRPRLPR